MVELVAEKAAETAAPAGPQIVNGEHEILKFWSENDIPNKVIRSTVGKKK